MKLFQALLQIGKKTVKRIGRFLCKTERAKGKTSDKTQEELQEMAKREEELLAEKKARDERLQQHYVEVCETYPVDKRVVLVESRRGKGMDESVMMLARLLCENGEYTLYASCIPEQMEERRVWLDGHDMQAFSLLAFDTEEYYRILATAGTLINEDNFGAVFIKRPEQTFLRLWNATPVNAIGKSVPQDYGMIGGTQRNLLSADYLLCPNRFTVEILEKEYMLSNLSKTKVLLSGRLENEVFVTEDVRGKLRKKYGWEGKKVFAYLPALRTYEGKKQKEYVDTLANYIRELDGMLSDVYQIVVKLPFAVRRQLDFEAMQHIKPMPEDDTPYQILSATDGLLTDYSAIMMDYAASGRKIIRFPFDEKEFLKGKKRYQTTEEFPFAVAYSVRELAEEICSGISYDATAFYEKYCSCVKAGMVKAVYRKVFHAEDSPLLEETRFSDNGKKNVLIYAGAFPKNGITTAVQNILARCDRTKYNYIVYYRMGSLQDHQEELRRLPEGVAYYGYNHVDNLSEQDAVLYAGWKENKEFPYETIRDILYKRSKRDYRRMLEFCRIDHAIQFDGYGEEITLLMEHMPCGRTIYAHNDMEMELEKKAFVRREVLENAYRSYDSVAIVTPDLIPCTSRLAGGTERLHVAKNVIDHDRILRLSREKLVIDKEKTQMNVTEKKLRAVLSSKARKFINIGRFSYEKGHLRLMDAFYEVQKKQKNSYLIILGGYGPMYEETLQKAASMPCADRIIIIQYLSNPYPLLAACDYFVLPSHYEGFGLVLAEADILGIPCFSTRITGPEQFMEQYGGRLVENSTEGIAKGMFDALDGKLPKRLQIDYEKYNKEAVEQFEALMELRR